MTLHPSIMTRYSAFGPGTRAWVQSALVGGADWLSAAELTELARIRDEKRRSQWTLGRLLAKRMIGDMLPVARSSDVQILSRAPGRGCRPRVWVNGERINWSLSISHTSRGVFVGLAASDELCLGVDLAADVPLDDRFRQMWFTRDERSWLAKAPVGRTSVLWALKEAAFKAGNSGQEWSPRQIEILPIDEENFQVTLFGHRLSPRSVDFRAIDGQLAATVCLPRTHTVCVKLNDVSVCL